MNSFFLVDKPAGMTSFDVLRQMKKSLEVKKMGHTGTLDPLATGCLLVAIGEYTKLIPYIEKAQKTYRATIQLDGITPSLDTDTEVTYISSDKYTHFQNTLTQEAIDAIMKKHFFGEIMQIPPKYSALKIGGKRALDRTLAGEDIDMKARKAEILDYSIESFSYPNLEIEITVSAGTYIRSIASDLGEYIGSGGYISSLRRTKINSLDIALSTPLKEITHKNTLSIEKIFPGKIFSFSNKEIYQRLQNGQRVRYECDFPENEDIFLSDKNMIRYIVEYKDGVIHPRKKIA